MNKNDLILFMSLCNYGYTLPKEENTLKNTKRQLINGKNYLNMKSLTEMSKALNEGKTIEVYIDCIGHSRNNYEQENYRKALQKIYGENLECEVLEGNYSYSYMYRLKE